jgi:hypothetical protein
VAYVAVFVLFVGAIAAIAAVGAGRGRAIRVALGLGTATFVLLTATLVLDAILLRHVSSENCPDTGTVGGELQIVLGIGAIVTSAAGLGAALRAAADHRVGGSAIAVTEALAAAAALVLTVAPWLCGLG